MKKFVKMVLTIAFCSFVLSSLFTLSACTCKHEWSDWTTLSVATCETEWVMTRSCNKCGTVENKKAPALGHAEVTDEAVEATCTTTGLTEGKHCSRCNAVLVKQETVKALGHVEVADEPVEATCTATGLTEGKHCSRCNAVLVKQETVKALGHKNKNGICLTCNEDISTKGLEYEDGADENTLILAGMGTATVKNIIIPAVYNGKKFVWIAHSPVAAVLKKSITGERWNNG